MVAQENLFLGLRKEYFQVVTNSHQSHLTGDRGELENEGFH